MSLFVGIATIALAIVLGGLAAMFRGRHERALPALRTFAVVAACVVALLHLLPEAVDAVGWTALVAAAVGCFGPTAIERAILPHGAHAHDAPTTALAMGYAAVVAHQAGEGAAVASLASTGALSLGILLAIAAHTLPLAMVVALRVLEVKLGRGARRATLLALAGVALATVAGALAGNVVGAARIATVQPWLLAIVAGLLLHALSHGPIRDTSASTTARAIDAVAGLGGLAVALYGIEDSGWIQKIPAAVRVGGTVVIAIGIVARSLASGVFASGSAHGHAHRRGEPTRAPRDG